MNATIRHPDAIAVEVRKRLQRERGHFAEVLTVALAESGVAYYNLHSPPETPDRAVVRAAIAVGVGVLSYAIGGMLEGLWRRWYTEPRAVRDAFAAELRTQAAAPPRIHVRCNSGSLLMKERADGAPLPLWMLWDVTIVNLSNHPVSLTFQLDTDVRQPDGMYSRTRASQDNGRRYIEELVPEHRLMGPVDIAPYTSVFGNVGFFVGVGFPEENPTNPKQMLLCLSDAVSQRSGRVGVGDQGICYLEGIKLPHPTEDA